MGRTLLQTIEQLIDWADSHVAAIHAAQATYDAKHRPEDPSPVDPEISACEEAERAARRGYSAPPAEHWNSLPACTSDMRAAAGGAKMAP